MAIEPEWRGRSDQRGYWEDETETGASVRETLRECFSGSAIGLRLSCDQAPLLNPVSGIHPKIHSHFIRTV